MLMDKRHSRRVNRTAKGSVGYHLHQWRIDEPAPDKCYILRTPNASSSTRKKNAKKHNRVINLSLPVSTDDGVQLQ